MQYCYQPGCSVLVERGYCARHQVAREHTRGNYDVRRWYRTARWRTLRARVLGEELTCTGVNGTGCGQTTTDVDHRQPHGGDPVLFWTRLNLQAKCHACHSRKTVQEREAVRASVTGQVTRGGRMQRGG
jgi:5-methylcytosine-specific restriction protein A